MATSYKPTGVYNDAGMSEEDKKKVSDLQRQWQTATDAGDKAGADAAHAAAEKVRANYGYSGGADGSEYVPLSGAGVTNQNYEKQDGTYKPAALPTYQPQEDRVNQMYDAAAEVQAQQLQSAYDKNMLEANAYLEKIPGIYQSQANALAANAEREKAAFNEYAAASGLSSGAGGQAQLAMANQNQANMTTVRTAQADAMKDAENQILALKTEYQNAVAQAIANNEYERASALLGEYQRQAESIVTTAQAQADENYRAWQSASDQQYRQWQMQQSRQETDRANAEAQAKTLAAYGDFSGYLALGYTQDQVSQMQQLWIAANPDLAIAVGLAEAPKATTTVNTLSTEKDPNINNGFMNGYYFIPGYGGGGGEWLTPEEVDAGVRSGAIKETRQNGKYRYTGA